ncbi:MAG: hypothetical protein FD167_5067 [bacterium]|nr:MAG: hypothetical protein FD167_5067 [bacterium]
MIRAKSTEEPCVLKETSTVLQTSGRSDSLTEFNNIANDHNIGAEIFIPFAIARLQEDASQTEVTLTVKLRNINGDNSERRLRLFWFNENRPIQPIAVQERVVTEWAACGVACAVIASCTNLRISQVAAEGDRFDYWLSGGEQEYGLEISGTMTDELNSRHNIKMRQLRDNPYEVDGYVVVIGFSTKEAIISFNSFRE